MINLIFCGWWSSFFDSSYDMSVSSCPSMSNIPSSAKGLKNLVKIISFSFFICQNHERNLSFVCFQTGQHVLHEQHYPMHVQHKNFTSILPELWRHRESQVRRRFKSIKLSDIKMSESKISSWCSQPIRLALFYSINRSISRPFTWVAGLDFQTCTSFLSVPFTLWIIEQNYEKGKKGPSWGSCFSQKIITINSNPLESEKDSPWQLSAAKS